MVAGLGADDVPSLVQINRLPRRSTFSFCSSQPCFPNQPPTRQVTKPPPGQPPPNHRPASGYPGIAQLKHNLARLRELYLRVASYLCLPVIPRAAKPCLKAATPDKRDKPGCLHCDRAEFVELVYLGPLVNHCRAAWFMIAFKMPVAYMKDIMDNFQVTSRYSFSLFFTN